MTAPRLYSAFGLAIASDVELDAVDPLTDPSRTPDLRIVRTHGVLRPDPAPRDPFFDITPAQQYLQWQMVGAFRIDRPDLVEIEPHAGVSDFLVSQALLGIVISLVLERQGVLCLHASAVSVGGRAAIFLGDKGAGKSTTNGALLARGHLPVTDDLVAVDGSASGEPPLVRPGFAAMKLWPDSLQALGLDAEAGDRPVHPDVTKLRKRMPLAVVPTPVPMGALFVLRRDPQAAQPQTRRLPPHEALQNVLRYTFMARYGETQLGQAHLVAHLRRCAAIVAQVPVLDLAVPADLSRLPDLARTIEETLAGPDHLDARAGT